MASSLYSNTINTDNKYINSYIGDNNDESPKIFNQQVDLINNINKNQKVNINTSDLNNKNYRINDSKTYIDGKVNISNPAIYPQSYDLYYDNYLHKKNLNSLNLRIIQKYNYINIDSQIIYNNVISNYYLLENNPLIIENGTSILSIKTSSSIIKNFKIGDKITLQGLTPFNKKIKNLNFTFTSGKNIVKTNLNYDALYSTNFNNLLIEFNNISHNNDYFYNIPVIALNNTFNCIILDNTLCFIIPDTFYSPNLTETLISNCTISYQFIANIPINTINAYEPLGKYNLITYHSIVSIQKDYIKVLLSTTTNLKLSSLTFGGSNIQIGNITETYINSDYEYLYNFNTKFFNIASFRIKSSELNIFSTNNDTVSINALNNNFYWSLFEDGNNIYKISLNIGNYTYEDLQLSLENSINNTKRINNRYNYTRVYFQPKLLLFNFTFYNKKASPKCLVQLTFDGIDTYTIKIYDYKHTLKIGDSIEIIDSIDYYNISKTDINTTHIITNAYENAYEITIKNINTIIDVGNTYGGFKISLLHKISAQLHMNYENSIGKILYFKNVGLSNAITKFSSFDDSYTINNQQNYLYTTNSTTNLISEISNLNSSYILLKIEKLNTSINPYNENYCYKFQIQKTLLNNTLFNTFVDNPLYFDPPLDELEKLKLTFITPKGEPINFKLFNYSLSLELITITNENENTELNLQLGRI
jgi:hypothetical protein